MPQLDTDNFNRADSTVLGNSAGGFPWVEAFGDCAIVANGVESVGDGVLALAYLDRDLGSADHYVEADITTPAGITRTFGGVVVRKAADAAQTFYAATWEVFNSVLSVRINKYVVGTKEVLATQAYGVIGETHRLRFEAQGSSLRLFLDSVSLLQVTNTAISTGTRAAIILFKYAANVSARIDNVAVGDFAAAAPPVNLNYGVNPQHWDNFTRADSTTLGTLPGFIFRSWAEISGNVRITASTVRSEAAAGTWSIARITGGPSVPAGRNWMEIVGRVLATGDSVMAITNKAQDSVLTFYAAQLRAEAGGVRLKLVRWLAGVEAVLANIAFGSLSTWYKIQCSLRDTAVVAFVDDVERLRVLDTGIPATGDTEGFGILAGGQIDFILCGQLVDEFPTPSGATFAAGTRSQFLKPFDALSPWNRPIGSGAVFTPVGGVLAAKLADVNYGSVGVGFNSAAFTFGVNTSTDTDPLGGLYEVSEAYGGYHEVYRIRIPTNAVYFTTTAGTPPPAVVVAGDATFAIVDPEQEYVYLCASSVNRHLDGFRANGVKRFRLKDSGRYPQFSGSTEDGQPSIHGLFRQGEISDAAGIKHVLQCALHPSDINDDFVWPANQVGQFVAPNLPDQTANVRHGTLLAIPPTVDINTLGITDVRARRIVQAMQDYGIYVVDKGGAFPMTMRVDYFARNDEGTDADRLWNRSAFRVDVRKGLPHLKVVSNNGPTAVGGGGTPGKPLLAPFGVPGPTPVGRMIQFDWDILPLSSGPVGKTQLLEWAIAGVVGNQLGLTWQVEGAPSAGIRTVEVLRTLRDVRVLSSTRTVQMIPQSRTVQVLPPTRTLRRIT